MFVSSDYLKAPELKKIPLVNSDPLPGSGTYGWVGDLLNIRPDGSFAAGNVANPVSYQHVELANIKGLTSLIKNFDICMMLTCWRRDNTDNDKGNIGLQFLNVSGEIISTTDTPFYNYAATYGWKQLTMHIAVPKTATAVRVRFCGQRVTGTECSAFIKLIRLYYYSLPS